MQEAVRLRTRRDGSVRLLATLVALAIAASAVPAEAQYFGRNKVQYEDFEFQVLETEHFDIYYYPEEEAATELAARMAERWRARLTSVLKHELAGRQPLILYAASAQFRQTNAIPGEIGEGTGGVTEAFRRRIVLPFAGPLADTDHVLGHELVHAFQFDITSVGGTSSRASAMPGALRLPLWFVEGMAEYLSLGPVDTQTAMWLREAVQREELPTIEELSDPRLFPYRWGHAFWAYVAGRWGDEVIGDLLRASGGRAGYAEVLETVLGVPLEELSEQWHKALHEQVRLVVKQSRPVTAIAAPLVTEERGGGRLNVGPVLSPDGSKMLFFSERDLFSIDLFVADVPSGEVRRKLTETATDPHFDSLQFLSSAGAWSPDGGQVALAVIVEGRPQLTIVDVESGDTRREIRFDRLGEILNPAWSPDGGRIAFSALANGVSDVFVYDLKADTLRQLTDDAFADIDPQWSPDGRWVAFATDRFTSNLDLLEFGGLRLALLDPGTGEIRQLAAVDHGKMISPRWGENAETLYFLSDRTGITNLYRMNVTSGDLQQVTDLTVGISGVTALSPAISIENGRIAFSVLNEGGYDLYLAEAGGAGAGPLDQVPFTAAALPPRREPGGEVATLLERPEAGLPQPQQYPTEPYDPHLSLDYVTQPSVGVGRDAFGTYVGGGIALGWSDMLGNHNLLTAVQASGRLEDIGGAVSYLNRDSRWNWGGTIEFVPYNSRGFGSSLQVVNGEPALVEQTLRVTQRVSGATGVASYPFSRAHRFELYGGGQNISFDRELRTLAFSTIDGALLLDEEEDLEAPDSLNLATTGAALVYDTSLFGVTSPILGRRYRFEVNQTAGSLTYTGALADFRQYYMPVRPFTIAARGLYTGRFGRDAEDPRLFPYFLGYSTLVRGYEQSTFEVTECTFDPSGRCTEFDQLIGSQLLIGNLEVRFPLWGLFARDEFYGPLPIEMALFGDAGVAWTEDEDPSFAGGSRDWVRSVGVALRVNLFGYAAVEIDYVRPLDRPERGWSWQFSFAPGF